VANDLACSFDPTSGPQLRAVLSKHGFRPRRSLGQTFLTDGNIVRKVVTLAGIGEDDAVVEIGAGAGAMTRVLASVARRVVAIEIDPVLVGVLEQMLSGRAEVMRADVLAVAWEKVFGPQSRGRWIVVANLPYSITGPAILRLLEARDWVQRIVIMVQREVAERIVAPPGGRTRGLLSVVVETTCQANLVAHVSRNCFWPRPKVDSALLYLVVRHPPLIAPALEPIFQQLVRAAFATRRKTMLNALANASELGLSKQSARALLDQCQVGADLRAEALAATDFCRLTEAMARLRGTLPA